MPPLHCKTCRRYIGELAVKYLKAKKNDFKEKSKEDMITEDIKKSRMRVCCSSRINFIIDVSDYDF